MTARSSESTVEGAALAWLESTGWRVAHGRDIAPDMPAAERQDYGEVALAQWLRDTLLPKPISGELRVKDAEQFLDRATARSRRTSSPPGGHSQPYTHRGQAYRRVGTTNQPMARDEYNRVLIERLHAESRWEIEPAAGWSVADLDEEEIRRTLEEGIRLFGRADRLLPDFTQCLLRVARFRGTEKGEFLDNRQFHGHAFDLFQRAQRFLLDHMPIAGHFEPGRMERIDEPAYSPLAFREAIANAICHRDYASGGSSIGVAIYDDRLEVTSSGTLHFGFTPQALFEPHESRPWNPLIASVFYRRGIIETWGQGTLKMAAWSEEAGLPKPEILEVPGAVVVRFRGKTTGKTTGKTPLAVLHLLAEDPSLTVPQLAARLEKSELTIHRAIRSLRESGRLQRILTRHGRSLEGDRVSAFTESVADEAALAWLESAGWRVAHGPDIAPDMPAAKRRDHVEVVLAQRLRDALARLNPSLSHETLEEVFRNLTRPEDADLIQRNRALHRLLVDGVAVEYRLPAGQARDAEGGIRGAQARVLDLDDPGQNDWLVVNQFTVAENRHTRRPDVVVFVNGLPLGLVELKNAAAENATIWTAFQQLQTYKTDVLAGTRVFSGPGAVLVRFARIADPLLAKISAGEHESRTLAALRDALLPRLVSGELRVEDPARILGRVG